MGYVGGFIPQTPGIKAVLRELQDERIEIGRSWREQKSPAQGRRLVEAAGVARRQTGQPAGRSPKSSQAVVSQRQYKQQRREKHHAGP